MRRIDMSGSFQLLCVAAAVCISCAGQPTSVPETDSGLADQPAQAAVAPAASEPASAFAPVLTPEERALLGGTALVVINMQAGKLPVVDGDSVLVGIARLARAAGDAGAPVFWGYLDEFGVGKGSPEHELAAPLSVSPSDVRIEWSGGDFFNDGRVISLLDQAGVGIVVIAGMSSDGCVNETVRGALRRGYRVIVPRDTHTIVSYPGSDVAGLRSILEGMNDRWNRIGNVRVMRADQVVFDSP